MIHARYFFACGLHVMRQCACVDPGVFRIKTEVPCPTPGCAPCEGIQEHYDDDKPAKITPPKVEPSALKPKPAKKR